MADILSIPDQRQVSLKYDKECLSYVDLNSQEAQNDIKFVFCMKNWFFAWKIGFLHEKDGFDHSNGWKWHSV